MKNKKWIGGFLGWITSHSIMGALAGFVLGSIFDARTRMRELSEQDSRQSGSSKKTDTRRQREGTRNSFLFSMMVLAAHIIRADGKIMHSEMELVREFLRQNFGDDAVEQGNDILLRLFDYRKQKGEALWQQQIAASCGEMALHMNVDMRRQLMAFLCEIAKADGSASSEEITALHDVAVRLGLNADIVEQLLHLGGGSLEDAYAVLGITKDATDDEVRKAFRKMALQYHPDKVATLGEDVKAAAEQKFKEINNAKELIYNARGMK